MKPSVGQIWYSSTNSEYVFVTSVGKDWVDFKNIGQEIVTTAWCELSYWRRTYKYIQG